MTVSGIGGDKVSIYLGRKIFVVDLHFRAAYVMNEVSDSGLPGCNAASLGDCRRFEGTYLLLLQGALAQDREN
jgi:hypothetical protein